MHPRRVVRTLIQYSFCARQEEISGNLDFPRIRRAMHWSCCSANDFFTLLPAPLCAAIHRYSALLLAFSRYPLSFRSHEGCTHTALLLDFSRYPLFLRSHEGCLLRAFNSAKRSVFKLRATAIQSVGSDRVSTLCSPESGDFLTTGAIVLCCVQNQSEVGESRSQQKRSGNAKIQAQ